MSTGQSQENIQEYLSTLSAKDRFLLECKLLAEFIFGTKSRLAHETTIILGALLLFSLCSLGCIAGYASLPKSSAEGSATAPTVVPSPEPSPNPTITPTPPAAPTSSPASAIIGEIQITQQDPWIWAACRDFLSHQSAFELLRGQLPDWVVYQGCVAPVIKENALQNPDLVHLGDKYKVFIPADLAARLESSLLGHNVH